MNKKDKHWKHRRRMAAAAAIEADKRLGLSQIYILTRDDGLLQVRDRYGRQCEPALRGRWL